MVRSSLEISLAAVCKDDWREMGWGLGEGWCAYCTGVGEWREGGTREAETEGINVSRVRTE